SLPIIVEVNIEDDNVSHTTWLPLPGEIPPTEDTTASPSNRSPAKATIRQTAYLQPNTSYRNEPLEDVPELDEEEESPESPDLNYTLRGDQDEDRKYYIYKVRDVNMVPKKECLGKVVVPA